MDLVDITDSISIASSTGNPDGLNILDQSRWESNSSQKPHWLLLSFNNVSIVREIHLYVTPDNDSYNPGSLELFHSEQESKDSPTLSMDTFSYSTADDVPCK